MNKNIVQFLWSVIKPYKWWYLMMLQAPFFSALYPLMYNYSIKLLLDAFTKDQILQYSEMVYPISLFIGAFVLLDCVWRIHNYAQLKSMPYIRRDLTCKVYNYVMGHSYRFFQNNLSGSVVSKIKGISDGYYHIHSALEHSLSKPLLNSIAALSVLFFINGYVCLMLIVFTIIYVPMSFVFFRKLGTLEKNVRSDYHKIIGLISDVVTNIFTIFSFATQTRETKQIEKHYNNINVPLQKICFKYDFWISIIVSLTYWILIVSVFLYMIHLKNTGKISIGDMAFIMSMTFVFAESVWEATMAMKDFIKDLADFKASFLIMQTPQDIIDKPNAKDLKINKGMIVFQNVSFAYEENQPVIDKLNLSIKAGEKIGIVGHSGAGKSTLIALLLKNFKATSGDILIDKQSIYDVTSNSLRKNISLIPQDIMLFHRNIGENIRYAKNDATREEVVQAAKSANIHKIIESLPENYNTLVGERGVKLSGGQRQRIAIARAILKNAPILILDEATSSLDTQTEQEIQKSINLMLTINKATVIAIAHRLSTIKHMDRIIVMDGGKIIEDGSFKELINKENGKFKELWDNQFNGLIV